MGELPASGEVIGLYPCFVGERNAHTEAMAGFAQLWAVLAAEEQGTPITTEAQAWRHRHLELEEEEERRPGGQAQGKQLGPHAGSAGMLLDTALLSRAW